MHQQLDLLEAEVVPTVSCILLVLVRFSESNGITRSFLPNFSLQLELNETSKRGMCNRDIQIEKLKTNENEMYNSFQFENLFWTILIPEWVIAICCKKNDASKDVIIRQILEEDEIEFSSKYSFEL